MSHYVALIYILLLIIINNNIVAKGTIALNRSFLSAFPIISEHFDPSSPLQINSVWVISLGSRTPFMFISKPVSILTPPSEQLFPTGSIFKSVSVVNPSSPAGPWGPSSPSSPSGPWGPGDPLHTKLVLSTSAGSNTPFRLLTWPLIIGPKFKLDFDT